MVPVPWPPLGTEGSRNARQLFLTLYFLLSLLFPLFLLAFASNFVFTVYTLRFLILLSLLHPHLLVETRAWSRKRDWTNWDRLPSTRGSRNQHIKQIYIDGGHWKLCFFSTKTTATHDSDKVTLSPLLLEVNYTFFVIIMKPDYKDCSGCVAIR